MPKGNAMQASTSKAGSGPTPMGIMGPGPLGGGMSAPMMSPPGDSSFGAGLGGASFAKGGGGPGPRPWRPAMSPPAGGLESQLSAIVGVAKAKAGGIVGAMGKAAGGSPPGDGKQ